MASPTIILGANLVLKPPPGMEGEVQDLHAFRNEEMVISAWQLSDEEVKDVVQSGGMIYLAVLSDTIQPVFVASEHAMRGFSRDAGELPWQPRPQNFANEN